MPVFVEKTSNLSKILCSHVIFFQIWNEKPRCCHAHIIFDQKRQFCQKLIVLWIKKVNRTSFFSDFHRKITSLMPIFCKEDVNYRKKNLLSSPYFIKKTSALSKTRCSDVIFSKILWKTPSCLSRPYLIKKRQLCQNYTLLCAKTIRCQFFPIFHKN